MKPLPPPHRPGQSLWNQAFFAASGFALGVWILRGMIGAHEPLGHPGVGALWGEPYDLTCINLGAPHYPTTLDPKLRALFNIEKLARETDTGRTMMDAAMKDGLRACFNPALTIPDAEGDRTVGSYLLGKRRIDFNPTVETTTLVSTMVHETRHRVQEVLEVNYMVEGNVRESERMALAWLTEADARLVTILAAREAHANGNSDQMERLLRDGAYRPMIYAMMAEEVKAPNDRAAQMAAGIKAFRQSRDITNMYDPNFIRNIVAFTTPYKPGTPRQVLLNDAMLHALGDLGTHGNYMTDDLKKFIRDSFTDQDWRDMKAAQDCLEKRKLGKTKELCSSWPRPSV